MKIALFFAAVVIAAPAAEAREIRMLERFNVGDYVKFGPTKPHKFQPHSNPSVLTRAGNELFNQRGNLEAVEAAKAYVAKYPGTTAMMLIDRGKIIFEAYQGMGNEAHEFYSMSIAKSMTSLAIGKALCNGVLKSLDVLTGDIVPELKINNYGPSTMRHLLTMSSGAFMTVIGGRPKYRSGIGWRAKTGKPYGGPSWPIRLGQITISDVLWGKVWDITENKNHAAPGEVFLYRNTEPMVMSKIIERLTGKSLAAYFDKHVWQQVRGAGTGHWEADIAGTTLAMSGFQVSLRDWGRIALWILAEHKKPGCFGDYLRQATTTQIKTSGLGGSAKTPFKGYGYQWWTDHPFAPGFWGKGHAGQELAINPESQKVLIKFGYRVYPGVSSGITKLYRNWHKN
tara:strand:- start:4746 stop:5936 length:1191 start_codon:yes stop_codon:yes gene_type:complete